MAMARLFAIAEDHGFRPVWFSCEPADGDLDRFLAQLETALFGRAPTHRDGPGMEELAMSVRRLGQPVVLFLDNYHVCESAEVGAALPRLIELAGPNLHIVLSSRINPSFGVASLRMRSLLGEFSRTDLAVERHEVAGFIGIAADRINDGTLDAIVEHTDGWVAALQFIRLLVAEGTPVEDIVDSIAGADENIRLYLYEEVFRSLSASMQDFLLGIAHLDRINAELAHAVTGLAEADALFDEVIDRNLFVIPLDRSRRWIRLHSVFRDFLIQQARRERRLDLHGKLLAAARWHWNNREWLTAVDYALDAGEPALAEQWLRECGEHVILDLGELPAFRSCCERLVALVSPGFDLISWMVWTAAFSLSWSDASRLLTRHLQLLEEEPDSARRVMLVRSLMTYFSHDFESSVIQAQNWWDRGASDNPFDRATVACMMAFSLMSLLRERQAKIWLDRARADIALTSSSYGHAYVRAVSAHMALVEGRTLDAWNEIVPEAARPGQPRASLAIMGPIVAEVHYERNMTDRAHALVERLLGNVEGCGVLDIAICTYKVAGMLAAHRQGAEEAIARIVSWSGHVERRYGRRGLAMLQLLKRDIVSRLPTDGRRELAMRIGPLGAPGGDAGWGPDLREWQQIIRGRELVVDGHPREALDSVKRIIVATHADGRVAHWVTASLIKVAAQRALGEVRKAERALIECLSRAAGQGMCRTVVDEAVTLRPFGPMLVEFSGGRMAVEADLRELIGLLLTEMGCAPSMDPARQECGPVEALTRQEARILALLAEGFSNADICDRLILSLSTVKWHIYNVFQKLRVNSRTAAVREGRHLGLVD